MVLLAGMGQYLLVTNTFSGDMSIFAVDDEGLSLAQTVATGSAPMSVAEHEGLIYVLNTGDPSLTGFRLSGRATSYGFALLTAAHLSSPRRLVRKKARPPRRRTCSASGVWPRCRARWATAEARSAGRWPPKMIVTCSPPISPTGPYPAIQSAPTAASRWTKPRPG
jgi:hypothetical protein